MKCPLDETELMMTERSGIEIDYCPKCRGVWLDRGELDKIVARAAESAAAAEPARPAAPADRGGAGRPWEQPARDDDYRRPKYEDDRRFDDRRYEGRRRDDDDDDDRRRYGSKRKSILGDIFDF
ncbi:zf-TFIIB domain-containing protein [Stella sp.]|uniref:TFIIB-type zinc ribbon-containing protein n=1 Tax=Stella sp. TaxID=2912054 RepID=UPI0035B2AB7A